MLFPRVRVYSVKFLPLQLRLVQYKVQNINACIQKIRYQNLTSLSNATMRPLTMVLFYIQFFFTSKRKIKVPKFEFKNPVYFCTACPLLTARVVIRLSHRLHKGCNFFLEFVQREYQGGGKRGRRKRTLQSNLIMF